VEGCLGGSGENYRDDGWYGTQFYNVLLG